MNSVLISIIRCHNPNFKETTIRNKRYAHYIEERDGVDKTVIQGSIENSSLFGKLDNLNGRRVEELVEEESRNKKCIYHGILSLREDDAIELGYVNKEKWQMLMKIYINQLADQFNIDYENMQWIAAYHNKNGHPHVHWMLWDKSDAYHKPFIHTEKQNECREIVENHILEEERTNSLIDDMIREDFFQEFGSKIIFKNAVEKYKDQKRNSFIEWNKEVLGIIGNELQWEMQYEFGLSQQYISPYESCIKTEDEKKLASMLLQLKEILPARGKLVYGYMANEVKIEIDKVSQFILECPYIKPIVNQYIKAGQCLNMSKKFLNNDVKVRVGNQIVKAVGKLIKTEKELLRIEERKVQKQKQIMQHHTAQVSYKLLRNVISELYNEHKKAEALEKMNHISNSDSKQAKREAARKLGAVKKPDNE